MIEASKNDLRVISLIVRGFQEKDAVQYMFTCVQLREKKNTLELLLP